MSYIHKRSFPPANGLPLGMHTVEGIPRTIGRDGQGDLAVWYESTPGEEHKFQVCWTGDELEEGFRLVQSLNFGGLVWHLAVPE